MLLEQDDEDIPVPPPESPNEPDSEDLTKISLHAMLGHTSPKIVRLSGKIRNHNVTSSLTVAALITSFKNVFCSFLELPILTNFKS